MSANEEIKKLKALLDEGAISEVEYNKLKEKETNSENEIIKNNETTPEIDLNADLTRYPLNVVNAGLKIKQAVTIQVFSHVFNLIGVFLIILAVINGFSSIQSGNFSVDEGALTFGIFFLILGFVFWIISLVKYSKAGTLLRTSESLFYGRRTMKINPDVGVKASGALRVGQDFAGGIVAYFDRTGKYVGIVSKDDISGETKQKMALSACKEHIEDVYNDWQLPDYNELKAIYRNLKAEGIGNLKNAEYWCSDSYKSAINFSNGEFSDRRFGNKNALQIRPLRLIKLV